MDVIKREAEAETTLSLKGAVRIGEVEQLKAALAPVLASPQPLVTLDLGGVDAIDVTFYQLALSLQKALSAQGRHLILRTLHDDHVVTETARLLGLPLAHHFTLVEASR